MSPPLRGDKKIKQKISKRASYCSSSNSNGSPFRARLYKAEKNIFEQLSRQKSLDETLLLSTFFRTRDWSLKSSLNATKLYVTYTLAGKSFIVRKCRNCFLFYVLFSFLNLVQRISWCKKVFKGLYQQLIPHFQNELTKFL